MADNVSPITIAATTLTGAATPLTPSTIPPLVVQLSVHDTPSASGSSCMPLISMQLEAWKAHHAQPQPQVAQKQAPPLVPLEPTVIVKAPVEGVEVISVRSASAKTEDCSSRPGID